MTPEGGRFLFIGDGKMTLTPTPMWTVLANIWAEDSNRAIIEILPVVRDFTCVCPNKLPGLPPSREVEFSIDLLPGTAPISNLSYQMAPRS